MAPSPPCVRTISLPLQSQGEERKQKGGRGRPVPFSLAYASPALAHTIRGRPPNQACSASGTSYPIYTYIFRVQSGAPPHAKWASRSVSSAIGNPLDPPRLVCASLGLGCLPFLTALSYREPPTTAKRIIAPMIPFPTARALRIITTNRPLRWASNRVVFSFLTTRSYRGPTATAKRL